MKHLDIKEGWIQQLRDRDIADYCKIDGPLNLAGLFAKLNGRTIHYQQHGHIQYVPTPIRGPPKNEPPLMITILVNWLGSVHGVFLWIIVLSGKKSGPGLSAISRNVSTDNIPSSENIISKTLSVDYDFSETFDLNLAAGRDFDASFGTDHTNAFLINEKAVKLLNWKNPENALGQKMSMNGKDGLARSHP